MNKSTTLQDYCDQRNSSITKKCLGLQHQRRTQIFLIKSSDAKRFNTEEFKQQYKARPKINKWRYCHFNYITVKEVCSRNFNPRETTVTEPEFSTQIATGGYYRKITPQLHHDRMKDNYYSKSKTFFKKTLKLRNRFQRCVKSSYLTNQHQQCYQHEYPKLLNISIARKLKFQETWESIIANCNEQQIDHGYKTKPHAGVGPPDNLISLLRHPRYFSIIIQS